MGIFILSNLLGSSVQITTLPLVILSPLQASGLVFNSICATLILGEPFTKRSFIGTVLVCAGAGLIAAFGAMREPAHSLDELLSLLARRAFVIWMLWQAALVAAILIGAQLLKRVGLRKRESRRLLLLRGLAFGAVSGVLSAHSLLVAKTAVELLVRTIVDRVNQFDRWQAWASLLGLVALALTQLYYMHRGLKLVTTSVLYPLVFCIYNIVAILDGLIYFQQLGRLPPLHGALIALGVFVLLLGVLALSWRLHHEDSQAPVGPQSALSPGLGLLNDEDDKPLVSDSESDSASASDLDDDSPFPTTTTITAPLESTPLLAASPHHDPQRKAPRRRSRADTGTQLRRQDRILAKTRTRRIEIAEANEIWEELADDLRQIRPVRRTRTRSMGSLGLPRTRSDLVAANGVGVAVGGRGGKDGLEGGLGLHVDGDDLADIQGSGQRKSTVRFLERQGRAASSHFPASSSAAGRQLAAGVERAALVRKGSGAEEQEERSPGWKWGGWWGGGQKRDGGGGEQKRDGGGGEGG